MHNMGITEINSYMKRFLFLILSTLVPVAVNAFADEAEIDGIKYFILTKGQTAEVRANRYRGDIVIPETVEWEGVVCKVTSIGRSAFSRCDGLTSVSIPSSVKTIGDYAFMSCISLTSVIIPNSVDSIGEYSFRDCQNLESIILSDSIRTIGVSAFSSCFSLSSIKIPERVTTICSSAFARCERLTSIIIPNNVISIGRYAFEGCGGLTNITIGSKVATILPDAFAECPELRDVFILAKKVPKTSISIFEDSFINYATLHVPSESIDAYKSAEVWNGFKSIIGL